MEMSENESDTHCTSPDVSVKQRPEPPESPVSLNESLTQAAETAPTDPESPLEK